MKIRRVVTALSLILLAYIIACRQILSLADHYSLHVYPQISSALSFVASAVPFSLHEIAVVVLACIAVVIIVSAIVSRPGWKKTLCRLLLFVVLVYDWMYLGWGVNYYRSSIYARMDTTPAKVDKDEFKAFLTDYTALLNSSYVSVRQIDTITLEEHVKRFYSAHCAEYGLCHPKTWQHPKKLLFNRLYSAVGVLGFMGPAFAESHINMEIPANQYPNTYAHEYSHLLGVTSEAEANWWAFMACRGSDDPVVRYSVYFSLLPHVWNNASRILDESEFKSWLTTVRSEAVQDMAYEQKFWRERRIKIIDNAQTKIYDLFLKGNGVPGGIADYSGVIKMLISLDSI